VQGGSLSDPTISLFMPAFNAEPYIREVFNRFPDELWRSIAHVWVINDGSTDGTKEALAALCRSNDKITAVHFAWNRGYGKAVKEGLGKCKNDGCDIAVCLHADGQYPPEAVVKFSREMAARRLDILQGSRIASGTALSGGMPVYKYTANRILTFLENMVFNLSMTDYHSGMLLYGRKTLDMVPFERLSDSFDIDLEMIACGRARGLAISEMPIPTRYAGETSHLNPVTYGLRVLGVMAKYLSGRYHRL
jgi:glycosyltransferase involved in cell wall biosynthesis